MNIHRNALLALLTLALILCGPFAFAAKKSIWSLNLKEQALTKTARSQILAFISQVESRLPQDFKDKIEAPVTIEFKDFDQKQKKLENPCKGVKQLMARAYVAKRRIQMNHLLISETLKGEAASETLSCGYKNYYRLALSTLIHEIAHIYDSKAGISKDPYFRELMKFRKQWTWKFPFRKTLAKNDLAERSPDAYEFKSLKESFAVNAEFFIMDPEFLCRKPNVASYLQRTMKHVSLKSNCTVNTKIFLDSSFAELQTKEVDINPDRIYQIHYLFASKGPQMMSKWGHAMYRLVLCAPHRTTVGPECLNDVNSHVVVGFRANITELTINMLKGLVGGYPSQVFLIPLPEVMKEYNSGELRDLESYPLKLSEDQKRETTYRILEQYWSYRGSYYFLTNNCASEAVEVLRGSLDDRKARETSGFHPMKMKDDLLKYGLAEEKVQTFESPDKKLRENLEVLKKSVPGFKWKTLEEFTSASSGDERLAIVESLNGEDAKLEPVIASFYVLESRISLLQWQKFSALVTNSFKKNATGQENVNLSEIIRRLEHWDRLNSGYGIPLAQDFREMDLQEYVERKKKSNLDLRNWIETSFPQQMKELTKTETIKAKLAAMLADGKP